VSLEVRRLIRAMSPSNPLWDATRTHGELLKLGIDVGHTSVTKYMAAGGDHRLRARGGFSATTLMGLLRWICWWCQQFRFSFSMLADPDLPSGSPASSRKCGWDQAPTYMLRDRHQVYGQAFTWRMRAMGIHDRPTSPQSPSQNAYAERLTGSRRECSTKHEHICRWAMTLRCHV
jgi:hypothetical protein